MIFRDLPHDGAADGACYNCQRNRPGIDTERHIEGEGDLFLCWTCCQDFFGRCLIEGMTRAFWFVVTDSVNYATIHLAVPLVNA